MHYPAQDITVSTPTPEGDFLFDIGTGSMVTFPCPYRVVEITEDQICVVTSHFIDSTSGHPENFDNYMRVVTAKRIEEVAVYTLKKKFLSGRSARILARQFTRAMAAHYSGDELLLDGQLNTEGLGLWGKIIASKMKDVFYGLWHDLDPPDNFLTIDLKTGQLN